MLLTSPCLEQIICNWDKQIWTISRFYFLLPEILRTEKPWRVKRVTLSTVGNKTWPCPLPLMAAWRLACRSTITTLAFSQVSRLCLGRNSTSISSSQSLHTIRHQVQTFSVTRFYVATVIVVEILQQLHLKLTQVVEGFSWHKPDDVTSCHKILG